MNRSESAQPAFSGAIAAVVMFAALARGAHDLWAASLVYAVLLVLAAVFLVVVVRREGATVRLPLALPALALLAAAGASTAIAANRFDAIFALKDLSAALITFFIGANAFRTDDDTDLLTVIIVPVLWVQVVTMIAQLVSAGVANGLAEAQGTLVNPNIQAAFAIFWVPPLAFRSLAARANGRRFPYFVSGLVAALAAIVLAGSTWALVCLGVALLGVFALRANRPARLWSFVVAGAALVAAALWYKAMRNDAWNVAGVPAPMASDRLRWWAAAIRMFTEHPWLGVGLGGFPSAYPAYKYGSGQSTLFAHSLPLMILAETGIAGGAAALFFIKAWKRIAVPAFASRGPFAVGAMLFVLSSLVNVGPEYLVNQLVFGLFLGIVVAAAPVPVWRPRASAAFLAVALAVLSLPLLAAPFLASRFIVDGKNMLVAHDASAARKAFDSAVELDSTSWEAYYGRALSLWTDSSATPRDRESAISDMRVAIGLNKLNGQLWRETGEMLKDAGRKDEARAALTKAVELRPGDRRTAEDLEKL